MYGIFVLYDEKGEGANLESYEVQQAVSNVAYYVDDVDADDRLGVITEAFQDVSKKITENADGTFSIDLDKEAIGRYINSCYKRAQDLAANLTVKNVAYDGGLPFRIRQAISNDYGFKVMSGDGFSYCDEDSRTVWNLDDYLLDRYMDGELSVRLVNVFEYHS